MFWTFLLLVVFFFSKTLNENWLLIRETQWNFNFKQILLVVILASQIYIVNVLTWHVLVRSLGYRISFLQNFKIWVFSNVARIVPSGVLQYGSKYYLLSNHGIPKKASVSIVLMEMLIALAVGFGISISSSLVILLYIAALVIIVWIASFFFNFSYLKLLAVFWLFIVQFSIGGAILLLLSQAVVPLYFSNLHDFIIIYSISWVVGFVAVFAPGGIGVQEVSISTFLTRFMPLPLAVIVSVLLRFIYILSEFITVILISMFVFPDVLQSSKHKNIMNPQ